MLSSPNKELELVLKLNSCVIVLFVFYLFLSFTIICLWDCLSCKHVDASQRPHYMFGRLLQIDSMINMYDLEFPTLTSPMSLLPWHHPPTPSSHLTTPGPSPSHPILPCDYSRAITLPPHPPVPTQHENRKLNWIHQLSFIVMYWSPAGHRYLLSLSNLCKLIMNQI